MTKILFILILVAVGQIECFATLQTSDFIVWNNDTLFLDKSPLEQLPEVCTKIREKEKSVSSGCWNGFVAEWILKDSVLYLKNLYSYSTSKIINRRLEKILDTKFVNGLIKADWFTGEIYGGFGRYLNCMFYLVYEKERKFDFKDGILKTVENFDAKNIEYSIDDEKVKEYVYQNFDWAIFEPEHKFHKLSSVFIEADNSGALKTVKFETSDDIKIDKEVERILRLIPNWGVYFWNGEMYNFFKDYNFEFNNEKMKKYTL